MILNNTPTNEAVLSNVGEIGEFRIRNSAKAFNILSSGLYANKIKAIIRELSCNAVDSHTAAGKADVPFDVHLPTQLEPHFSIRDYGTGLNHDQVTNIYTTYFESTKTTSNEFIGALGLGSKSPFSYTDNFTVTAIKDGRKGIYTAFINEQGVPSIALMMEEQTQEPNGVEVKFSVNDRQDFYKFQDEAREVYQYFKLRPVISGPSDFKIKDIEYSDRDIVPGVHALDEKGYYGMGGHARAVMGNIAYPIDLPNPKENLGPLYRLLGCGLEMHFAIGELDFQASREGLSYIPLTIENIKKRLEAVNAVLYDRLADGANKIANLWERAEWLQTKARQRLWEAAVIKYVTDTKLPVIDHTRLHGGYLTLVSPKYTTDDLKNKFNISLRGFIFDANYTTSSLAARNKSDYGKNPVYWQEWVINVDSNTAFVLNDTKIGAVERAKHHYRVTKTLPRHCNVYVVDAADKTQPVKFKEFMAELHDPVHQLVASSLAKKERVTAQNKDVTILKMERKGEARYARGRMDADDMVWRDAGKMSSFNPKITYYYMELSGYTLVSKYKSTMSPHEIVMCMVESGLPALEVPVYGVRKTDIESVKAMKNWVNIEDHISKTLAALDKKTIAGMALTYLDEYQFLQYNDVLQGVKQDSPFHKLVSKFAGSKKINYIQRSMDRLCTTYAQAAKDPKKFSQGVVKECEAVNQRYPLLACLQKGLHSHRNTDECRAIIEYINVIDESKKVSN